MDSDKHCTKITVYKDVKDTHRFKESKARYHYKTVDRFFKNTETANIEKMLLIVDQGSDISLRLLDWFITKYANKKKINYTLDDSNEYFNIHISYKAQLKSYKKTYFDPFRRGDKFYYRYDKLDNTKMFYTTIGQLNFFKWLFSNKIIEYVEKNYDTISRSMATSNKNTKKKITVVNSDGVKIQAKKKVTENEVKIRLSFD